MTELPIWVREAQEGDRRAFEKIVRHIQDDLFRMVYARTISLQDAEDLTQEILIAAYRKIRKLKDPERFRPWLYRIAINRIRDYHRKSAVLRLVRSSFGSSSEVLEPSLSVGPDSRRIDRREFWSAVHRFCKKLSRMEREVFQLRFIDELTFPEIAETLGKNENTVKTYALRAVKKLRKESDLLDLLRGFKES